MKIGANVAGRPWRLAVVLAVLALVAVACGQTEEGAGGTGAEGGTAPATPAADGGGTEATGGTEGTTSGEQSAGRDSEWFDEEEYNEQLEQRGMVPEGPEDQPWLQAIAPENVDTSEYQMEPPYHVCFSNASVTNPWRVVGWTTMQEAVELQGDTIGEFTAVDAEGSDEQQISDIEGLLNADCDILIVSPNTTQALTPVVEQACEQLPVIVFDRGVNTDCPVTFIKPIGGYAFGADAAEFLVEAVPEGGKILPLRILPGVDVLETRFVAAQVILEEAGYELLQPEFTEGDAANVKSIVTDYLQRGEVDGVWMDAGATSVAAAEAFEDAGLEVPPITGEDQMDWLAKWQNDDLTGVAPTYPTFQWRTPIEAAVMILSGEEVPGDWTLPQPVIVEEGGPGADLFESHRTRMLSDEFEQEMPPLHYALCGCEEMPDYPGPWQ